MTTHRLLSIGLLAASVFALRNGRADIVILNDGTETEGEVVHEDTQTVTLRVHMGAMSGTIEIHRCDIKSIKVTDVHADPAIAEGKKLETEAAQIKDIPKAIEAWLKVGEFYDHHAGFSASSHAAFERVILLDPENAKAREKLGYVKAPNGGWISKDEIRRAEQREREAAQAKAAAAKLAQKGNEGEDITIEIRRDNDLVKRMKEQQAELVQGAAEADQGPPRPIQPIGYESYFGPWGGFGFPWNGAGIFGVGGYGFSDFGGFGGYGFSSYSSYSGGYYPGISFRFHGKIGNSGHFSGRIGF
jgi:hypothetical protein